MNKTYIDPNDNNIMSKKLRSSTEVSPEGRMKRIRNYNQEAALEEFKQEAEESFERKRPRFSTLDDSDEGFSEKSSISNQLDMAESSNKANSTFSNDDIKDPVSRMMKRMGYQEGRGLGKYSQGIQEPIKASTTRGLLGLGHNAAKELQIDLDTRWEEEEEKPVEESPDFLKCENILSAQQEIKNTFKNSWIIKGKPVDKIETQDLYCAQHLISELVKSKNVFDYLQKHELEEARARANPYETIKSGIFQNRAAMKTANLDRIFGWRLSQEFDSNVRNQNNPFEDTGNVNSIRKNKTRQRSIFYFADVCAGPGGFSEYMLWRKAFYNAKGFGFTLKGKDDFKLWKFKAASSAYFDPYYGKHNDGDITNSENLELVFCNRLIRIFRCLEKYVSEKTFGQKVHLVMADGGFSVDGQENLQEVLSKRIYLCQFIAGLSLCRVEEKETHKRGGNFVCKLFDIFTPFSVGLIYLMYLSFDQISLHKPHTSRPANSERYIFCENLNKFGAEFVKNYFVYINDKLHELAISEQNKEEDILEIVPQHIIKNDSAFFDYLTTHNEKLIERQIRYLQKYKTFAKAPGEKDKDQGNLRVNCLAYWEVPNQTKEDIMEKQKPIEQLFFEVTKWEFNPDEYDATIPFSLDVLRSSEEKRLRSQEIMATFLTDEKDLMFVISTWDKVYCRELKSSWRLLNELTLVLPKNTVLLAHVARRYKLNEFKRTSLNEFKDVLRIVDAVVLDGDWIADLPYPLRLQAIKKFCATVNKPGHKKFDPKRREETFNFHNEIISAESYSIPKLVEQMESMKKSYKGGEHLCFQAEQNCHKQDNNNNEFFICKAVRFVQVYKDMICWSNSAQKIFYFDSSTNKRSFEEKNASFSSTLNTIRKATDRRFVCGCFSVLFLAHLIIRGYGSGAVVRETTMILQRSYRFWMIPTLNWLLKKTLYV